MATYKLVDGDKLDAAMTATADAIRAKTGSTDPIAWDAEKGMSEAVEGISADSYYDAFWDGYQDNGKKVNYEYGFAGSGWNDDTFIPKYDIVPTSATHIFSGCNVTDVEKFLKNAGVTLDFSNSASVNYICQKSSVRVLPIISTLGMKDLNYFAFDNRFLNTIRNIILKNDGTQTFKYYSFGLNPELKEIRFEGIIGQNGFDIHDSQKLSKDSILSIVNALSNSTTGMSITLSLTAVNTAFEISPGAADGSASEEWTTLIATKPNWTISLV